MLGAPSPARHTRHMAWRIDESVIRGEIDNRTPGRTTGRIWLLDRDEPIELDLEGNPWRDLAGHVFRFTHKSPQPGKLDGLFTDQQGVVGDITASRKVKVPEIPVEEMYARAKAGLDYPWHLSNSLYLEWFSMRNGRVVIESTDYQIEIDPEPAWRMDEADEEAQRHANAKALTGFMERLADAMSTRRPDDEDAPDDFDDDEPQSEIEAQAEADTAYMDKLLDRIEARIEREGFDPENFDTIREEERLKLRKEMGLEPERPPTPEEIEERSRWIEEMNAAAEEAVQDMEAEAWKDHGEIRQPPLVGRATEFGISLHKEIRGMLPEDPPREHPLIEITNGVQIAAAKLAGALGFEEGDEEWPPDPLFAGDTIVRLKKARSGLRDSLLALDSADEEKLGTPEWRTRTRREVAEILGEVQGLIDELRRHLADHEKGGEE